jgi:hypothetical protein
MYNLFIQRLIKIRLPRSNSPLDKIVKLVILLKKYKI